MSPDTIGASGALIAPMHGPLASNTVMVRRDEPYGPLDRQRLDLFMPASGEPTGIVIFVHGGAFVAGSKHTEGSPYHDNIGAWCAANSRAAVTMNYRLAPGAPWPAAAEDIDLVVAWCRARLRHDQALLPVHLAGTSSGAVHIASYLVGGPGWERSEELPASAAFFSGVYDLRAFGVERVAPYFGGEPAFLHGATLAQRLVETPVPMLFAIGEWDTPDANVQFARAIGAFADAGLPLPRLVRARAANHFTLVNAIGTPADDLSPSWADLMDSATP
ncbi:alpha/beta hydrolase [Microbacterium elymi]|uniref:Alpha/beta hydrolase fold domain-containing protein n=1 Tax=Microbacterium elymi TaxID=2909587 RepID=A0ABY5NHS8_9MICO|nr:alpha/beta hydrolase fold domain-containing protein [Microbacterium elymi]UUT34703.1 alpha/beta hydrolase fold domain-containing protein [Microbacterium elymi]